MHPRTNTADQFKTCTPNRRFNFSIFTQARESLIKIKKNDEIPSELASSMKDTIEEAVQLHESCFQGLLQNQETNCKESEAYLSRIIALNSKIEENNQPSSNEPFSSCATEQAALFSNQLENDIPELNNAKQAASHLRKSAIKEGQVTTKLQQIRNIELAANDYLACRNSSLMFIHANPCQKEEQELESLVHRYGKRE